MHSRDGRALAVALVRLSLALYITAAGVAVLTSREAALDPAEPPWLPLSMLGAFAPAIGSLLAVCGVLLIAGYLSDVVSVIVAAQLVLFLMLWLVQNPLHNTMNHLVPLTAATLFVFAAAPHDRYRVTGTMRWLPFDGATRASVVVLAARLFLGSIFLAQGIRSISRRGLAGFAERVYVAPFADSWIPERLLWLAGVTNPPIQICGGILLLLGLRTRWAATAVGAFLVTIFFGHLVGDPFDRGDSVHAYAMANFLVAVVILWLHGRGDRFSVDRLLERVKASPAAAVVAVICCAACATASAATRVQALLAKPDPATVREALRLIGQAKQDDPTLLAAAVDAHIHSQRHLHVPRRVAEARARHALRAASEMRPDDRDVIVASAKVALIFDLDRRAALERLERVLRMAPDDPATRFEVAQLLAAQARVPEALEQLDRAVGAAPALRLQAGRLLYMAGRYAEVFASYEPMPNDARARAIAHFYRGLTLEQQGRIADAVPEHEAAVTLLERDAGAVGALARTYALAGRRKEAADLIEELLARRAAGRHVVTYQIAAAYEALHDDDAAFLWLRHAVDARDPWLVWLDVDPRWKRLRRSPRFAALLDEVGAVGGRADLR